MSEYSELIKTFDRIRDYMRDFYVYGFKSREDFDKKSLRTYDNEKRRIESYLGEYMSFSKDESGKNVFIAADCSEISANPLYRAFKAKSFTKNDITLHFILLDLLAQTPDLSAPEIAEQIASEYLTYFEHPTILDVSTIRGKLNEYEQLGLLCTRKDGKKLLYCINKRAIDVDNLTEALLYFSETSPLGVVGSFLLDKIPNENHFLRFKHHYIMHALESEIVYELLQAMKKKQMVRLTNISRKSNNITEVIATPLKILISVQSGRRYITAQVPKHGMKNFRLDSIKSITPMNPNKDYDQLREKLDEMFKYTWGSSFGDGKTLETLSMKLYIPPNETYMIERIQREGRQGILKKLEENIYEYTIEVYDTTEMMPWIRTFIGRITALEGTNKRIIQLFHSDMDKMYALYGGNEDDIF